MLRPRHRGPKGEARGGRAVEHGYRLAGVVASAAPLLHPRILRGVLVSVPRFRVRAFWTYCWSWAPMGAPSPSRATTTSARHISGWWQAASALGSTRSAYLRDAFATQDDATAPAIELGEVSACARDVGLASIPDACASPARLLTWRSKKLFDVETLKQPARSYVNECGRTTIVTI